MLENVTGSFDPYVQGKNQSDFNQNSFSKNQSRHESPESKNGGIASNQDQKFIAASVKFLNGSDQSSFN